LDLVFYWQAARAGPQWLMKIHYCIGQLGKLVGLAYPFKWQIEMPTCVALADCNQLAQFVFISCKNKLIAWPRQSCNCEVGLVALQLATWWGNSAP